MHIVLTDESDMSHGEENCFQLNANKSNQKVTLSSHGMDARINQI